jgi:hypothetical protein
MALQHLRSSTANKRPLPAGMSDGQLAINTNLASPGLFLKNSNGDLVKVGPVHVGTTAPNVSPAAGGETGNTTGELWLDTSLTPNELKTWNGSSWVSATGQEIPVSKLIDGSARQLLQTDAAGTGVEWTSNVDVPGTLDVTSTATFDSIASHPLGSAGAPTITFTGDTNTGIYSPGADQVAVSTGGTGRLFVDSTGVITTDAGYAGSRFNIVNSVSTYDRLLAIRNSNLSTAFLGLGLDSFYIASGGAAPMVFCTNSDGGVSGTSVPTNERLRITSAGLVGVGTSTPAYTLVAKGGVATTGIVASIINPVSGGNSKLHFTDDATYNWTAGTIGNAFAITPTEASTSAGTPALYIDSSRRVGVGTTSPGSLLECYGTGVSTAATVNGTGRYRGFEIYASGTRTAYFNDDSTGNIASLSTTRGNLVLGTGDTERVRIDSSGRLGIGTSSPSVELSIAGSDPQLVLWEGSDGASSSKVQLGTGLVQGFINIHKGDGTRTVQISSDDTSYFNGGNVGIGTSAPSQLLELNGASNPCLLIKDTTNNVIAYTFADDSVANFGSASAHPVVFRINNIEAARIDTSNRLLVGTSTAFNTGGSAQYSKLQIVANSLSPSTQGIVAIGRGTTAGGSITSGSAIGTVVFTDSAGGEFGLITCEADGNTGTGDYPGRLVFSTTADGASSPTERMRILSTGSVLFSTDTEASITSATANGHMWYESTQSWASSRSTTGGASHFVFYNPNGVVGTIQTSASATSYNTSSDYRLKENVTPVTDGITRLQQLKPSRFNFIADSDRTVDGFLAHEVQTIVPEAITGEKDAVDDEGNPEYQGIDQSKLVPLLTAALQEAIGEIESLKARVAALETP